MEYGAHAPYIWASYGVTLVVMAALLIDSWRRLRRSRPADQDRRRP